MLLRNNKMSIKKNGLPKRNDRGNKIKQNHLVNKKISEIHIYIILSRFSIHFDPIVPFYR